MYSGNLNIQNNVKFSVLHVDILRMLLTKDIIFVILRFQFNGSKYSLHVLYLYLNTIKNKNSHYFLKYSCGLLFGTKDCTTGK